jgi:hypothetical protein
MGANLGVYGAAQQKTQFAGAAKYLKILNHEGEVQA